jgi:hypothetical protein
LQNSTKDFEAILSKFIPRLTERGHQLENLIPLFNQAAMNLSAKTATPSFPNTTTRIIMTHYTSTGNTTQKVYNKIQFTGYTITY